MSIVISSFEKQSNDSAVRYISIREIIPEMKKCIQLQKNVIWLFNNNHR